MMINEFVFILNLTFLYFRVLLLENMVTIKFFLQLNHCTLFFILISRLLNIGTFREYRVVLIVEPR